MLMIFELKWVVIACDVWVGSRWGWVDGAGPMFHER